MELIYLWVEDYKNIKNQGFNFSPKFNCEYDEDTKELTINKNDDYIDNFFGDNINVTAIVGKNGSGKSSVLEFIVEWISNLFGLNFNDMVMMYKNLTFIFYSKKEEIIIPIWVTSNDISIINNTYIKITNNILKSIISEDYKEEYKHILKTKVLPNKRINPKERIKLDILKQSKLPEILKILKNILFTMYYDYSLNKFGFYNDFEGVSSAISLPNKDLNILSDLNYDKTIIIRHLISNQYINNDKYFEPKTITIRAKTKITNPEIINIPKQNITPLETVKFILNQSIISMINDSIDKKTYTNLLINPKELNEYINDNFTKLEKKFHYKNSKQLHTDNMDKALNYYKLLKEKASNNLFEFNNITIQIHINLKEINNNNIEILTEIPYNCFNIEVQDKNFKNYEELSSGEKSALRIRFYIEYIINKKDQNNFFILLDEPANDMHPDWQKRLLKYLIDIFKDRKQNIHFIITSHSPFLLSDIPKQNIIFLDTDKDGNCLVVDGLKEKKQTFGANIHTLLSDSFFMEDGLMGEFAKNKIDKVIELLNQDNLNKKDLKYCEQIISIIGEPIIKNQLQRMLDSKRLKKIDEIDSLKKSMLEIQNRLDELENVK